MRLIDADKLPRSWQPDCNGNKTFVDWAEVNAAPVWSCEECKHEEVGDEQHIICDFCRGFSNFERRGDEAD